jgi:hypothetical protein
MQRTSQYHLYRQCGDLDAGLIWKLEYTNIEILLVFALFEYYRHVLQRMQCASWLSVTMATPSCSRRATETILCNKCPMDPLLR